MTTPTDLSAAMAEARAELCQAIGLAQAQFADPNGPGFDSCALIEAIDAFEQATIRAALEGREREREMWRRELAWNHTLRFALQSVWLHHGQEPPAGCRDCDARINAAMEYEPAALDAATPAAGDPDDLPYDVDDGPEEPWCWGPGSPEHETNQCLHNGRPE